MSKFNKLLQERNMTQYRLGKLLGISVNMVHYWSKGRSIPRLPEVVKIAELLNVSIEEVVLCFVERK